MTVTDIMRLLRSSRFRLTSEADMQADIETVLKMNAAKFEREVRLSPEDRIDFMIGSIGLECKTRTAKSKMEIYRQLERYAKHDAVTHLILATNRAMGLPETIGGKPAYYVALGQSWL